MKKAVVSILYLIAMIALIVGLDLTLLRDHLALRLIVNIGIVLVFGFVYLKYIYKR